MAKFKVGDRVRCTQDCDPGQQFTKGKVYVVRYHYHSEGDIGVKEDDLGRVNGWCAKFFEPVTPSPIRTVTRRKIVPGYYAGISVSEPNDYGVRITAATSRFNAEELREAARIFTEIADVLEDGNEEAA